MENNFILKFIVDFIDIICVVICFRLLSNIITNYYIKKILDLISKCIEKIIEIGFYTCCFIFILYFLSKSIFDENSGLTEDNLFEQNIIKNYANHTSLIEDFRNTTKLCTMFTSNAIVGNCLVQVIKCTDGEQFIRDHYQSEWIPMSKGQLTDKQIYITLYKDTWSGCHCRSRSKFGIDIPYRSNCPDLFVYIWDSCEVDSDYFNYSTKYRIRAMSYSSEIYYNEEWYDYNDILTTEYGLEKQVLTKLCD